MASVNRETPMVCVVLLLVSLGWSLPHASAGEPIVVPDQFATSVKPLPKSWQGKEFKVKIESVPTGDKGAPQLRIAESSGEKRADRIAIAYAAYILKEKPELRAMNKTNMLTFPMVIDGGGVKAGKPRRALHKHASLNKPKGGFKDRTARKFEPVRAP